jgi:hypothetical protein
MLLPVMKADMWRYAILYIHGGVYADINAEDRVPIQEWGIDQCGLWAGQENNKHLCQWTFAAAPGNQVLQSVLELIVERFSVSNTSSEDFQKWGFVHEFTGPQVFTDGVNLALPFRLDTPFQSFNRWTKTWLIRAASWASRGDICIASQSAIRYNPEEGYTTSFVHNHFEWHIGWVVGQANKFQKTRKKLGSIHKDSDKPTERVGANGMDETRFNSSS